MPSITISTGATIDTTGDDYLNFQQTAFIEVGKSVRFNMGPAAVALQDLYQKMGTDLIFRSHDGKEGEWRYWTGRYWAEYHTGELRKDLSHLVGETVNGPQIDILEKTIKLRSSVPWHTFDRQPMLVLKNGTLRLDGKTLTATKGYTKEDYTTFELPLAWKKVPTPRWDTMLHRMLPDPKDRAALQELFGAVFFPSFQMQTVAAIVGKAGSGKSTVTAILRDMLGKERVSAIQACQLSGDHYMAGLVGKFVNLDAESEFIQPADEVLLKRISGGDPVTINQKNKPVYEATLQVKWCMVCEELPKFSSKTEGFWSRLVIIPFDTPIPANEQLPLPVVLDQLRPEYPGIFGWAMDGLQRLLSQSGTRGKAFSRSERAAQILADHRVFSNPLLEWLEQYVVADPDASENRREVYDSYRRWMTQGGHKPLTLQKFNRFLTERGFEDKQTRAGEARQRVWAGLKLARCN